MSRRTRVPMRTAGCGHVFYGWGHCELCDTCRRAASETESVLEKVRRDPFRPRKDDGSAQLG